MNLEIQPERTHNFAAYQKELFKLSQSYDGPRVPKFRYPFPIHRITLISSYSL